MSLTKLCGAFVLESAVVCVAIILAHSARPAQAGGVVTECTDAGLTQAPAGMEVTAVEYKINFLAAFEGGELRATGRVVRAGKRVMVTSAEVTHVDADGQERACALMQQTLMPVPRSY